MEGMASSCFPEIATREEERIPTPWDSIEPVPLHRRLSPRFALICRPPGDPVVAHVKREQFPGRKGTNDPDSPKLAGPRPSPPQQPYVGACPQIKKQDLAFIWTFLRTDGKT